MNHDVMSDGSCSCGATKSCPSCGGPLNLIGYDGEDRYGFGHIWDMDCRYCPEPTWIEEDFRGG